MYFELVQTNKELFAANFNIVEKDLIVGNMHLEGHLGSMEGAITISYNSKSISLTPGANGFEIQAKSPFRPYQILINGVAKGIICQTECKAGLFNKYDFHQIEMGNEIYEMYPIGFGQEGAKNPVYVGGQQKALIEKDCEVIDDLHTYKMTYVDEMTAFLCLVFSAYMYVNAAYKPGTAVTKSVHKVISKSTNKALLLKYDPSFKQRHFN